MNNDTNGLTTSNQDPTGLTDLVKGGGNFLKSVAQGSARFAVSAGEGIGQLITGGKAKPLPPTEIPGLGFLGPIQTYGSKLTEDLAKGESPTFSTLKSVGNAALDEPIGYAAKPVIFGLGILAQKFGKQAVSGIAKIISKTEDPVTILLATRQMNIDDGAVKPFLNKLIDSSSPGNVEKTLEDIVSNTPNAGNLYGPLKNRGFVDTVKQSPKTAPELASRVSGQTMTRSTEKLYQDAVALVESNMDEAHIVAKGLDDKAVATAQALADKYVSMAEGTTGRFEKNVWYDKAGDLINDTATKLTEAGRTVQAASIWNKFTPVGVVRWATKKLDETGIKLTPEQIESLTTKAKNLDELVGEDKLRAVFELTNEVERLSGSSSFIKKGMSLWKAGLLTGIKTSGLNISSNIGNNIAETVKDAPAALADKVFSLFTGKRTSAFTIQGVGSGTKEGVKRGYEYLKTGYSPRLASFLGKLDQHKVNFGDGAIGKSLQAYNDTVFRLIGAEDQPFYYAARNRSLFEQALAGAKNAKLNGDAFNEFVEKFVQNPPEEALKYSLIDAETAVFQNNTLLGNLARGFKQASSNYSDVSGAVTEFIIPFSQTPSAVAMQVINYTPVGTISEIAKQIKNGKFDQRLMSKAIGRSVTGTGVLWLGTELYKSGMISLGTARGDTSQRATNQLTGTKENAILIGGKWHSVNVLGPAGNLLLVGGYFQRALEQEGSPTAAWVAGATGALKSIKDQTFVTNMSAVLDAIDDPVGYGEAFAKRSVGSIVPTIVSDVAQATDDTSRSPQNIGDAVKARIPGLRQEVTPTVNAFGQDVKRPQGPIGTMINPARSLEPIKGDRVVNAISSLGINVSFPNKSALNKQLGKTLTDDEYTGYVKLSGTVAKKRLDELTQNPEWAKITPQQKEQIIDTVMTNTRSEVKAYLFPETRNYQMFLNQAKSMGYTDDDSARIAEKMMADQRNHTTP